MRSLIGIGVIAAAVALTSSVAAAKPAPKRPAAAASAERYGVATSYRAPTPGPGYTARARHIADCLATYSSRYDPHTDKVALRGGATRRCGL